VRDKTRESYSHLLRNLEALLGNTALDDISSQGLYEFLLLLTEGRSRLEYYLERVEKNE
jgi:hypothetical protein